MLLLDTAGDAHYAGPGSTTVLLTPAFVWALIGLVMIGAEFFTPGLFVVFFGIGALATAALGALLPGLGGSILLQILTWLGASGLSFLFLRRRLARVFRGRLIGKDEDSATGKKVLVTERIAPEAPGRVRLEGTSWAAASYDETFEPGETVEILGREGLTLYVTRSIVDIDVSDGPKTEGP